MKKMKGIVGMEAYPCSGYPNPRADFRHRSLVQDFQELQQETESIKESLERVKHKKLTLLAEVSFLRRRYKYLMKNQASHLQSKQDPVQPKNSVVRSKNIRKQKNYNPKESHSLPPVPRFNVNQKGRTNMGKESISRDSIPTVDLNQKERSNNRNIASLPNSAPTRDLIQNLTGLRESEYTRKAATMQKMTPIFDLNQISTEEEELQVDGEALRMEEAKKSSIRAVKDEQPNDVKLSICRNIGNGSSRAGKRKISWQDQMALRV